MVFLLSQDITTKYKARAYQPEWIGRKLLIPSDFSLASLCICECCATTNLESLAMTTPMICKNAFFCIGFSEKKWESRLEGQSGHTHYADTEN